MNNYAFYMDWEDLPEDYREEKIDEVREKLVAQEKGHYVGAVEDRIQEEDPDHEVQMTDEEAAREEERYLREEVWNREEVERHIRNHFPVYF